jgi:hypothetical protein
MKIWSLYFTAILCILRLHGAEEKINSAQLSLWKKITQPFTKNPPPKYEPLDCFYNFPPVIQRIVAEYCIGTENNVCPLLVRALALRRVITHTSAQVKGSGSLRLNIHDDDPVHMSLMEGDGTNRIVNSFNFIQGALTYTNKKIGLKAERFRRILDVFSHNKLVHIDVDVYNPLQACISNTQYDLVPENEDGRAKLHHRHQITSIEREATEEGYLAIRHDHSRVALLSLTTLGQLQWHWIEIAKGAEVSKVGYAPHESEISELHPIVELHPSTPLNINHQISSLAFSGDGARLGILLNKQLLVTFDGITGTELGRWLPPDDWTIQSCHITGTNPVEDDEQKASYEFVAWVKKGSRIYTSDWYLRYSIDDRMVRENILLREGTFNSLFPGQLLETGPYISIAFDVFSSQKLISCGSHHGMDLQKPHILWDIGTQLSDDHNHFTKVSPTSTGSAVALMGTSRKPITKGSRIHKLFVTLVQFEPSLLYKSDLEGVTDASLLRRVTLLNGLCMAAHRNIPVTLTAEGARICNELQSEIQANLQTTMPLVTGWPENERINDFIRECSEPIFLPDTQKSADEHKASSKE